MTTNVKLSNINNGVRNPKIEMSISSTVHAGIEGTKDWRSVYIHIKSGILSGGFHTTVKDAEKLAKALQKQIEIAKEPKTKKGI